MPIIKSAIKKLRKDIKREKHNREIKESFKEAIKLAENKKTEEVIKKAISLVNKAAKTHTIHKNKAARLTSKLSKLIDLSKKPKTSQKKIRKKVEKKLV